jgi:hypothetical protein
VHHLNDLTEERGWLVGLVSSEPVVLVEEGRDVASRQETVFISLSMASSEASSVGVVESSYEAGRAQAPAKEPQEAQNGGQAMHGERAGSGKGKGAHQ